MEKLPQPNSIKRRLNASIAAAALLLSPACTQDNQPKAQAVQVTASPEASYDKGDIASASAERARFAQDVAQDVLAVISQKLQAAILSQPSTEISDSSTKSLIYPLENGFSLNATKFDDDTYKLDFARDVPNPKTGGIDSTSIAITLSGGADQFDPESVQSVGVVELVPLTNAFNEFDITEVVLYKSDDEWIGTQNTQSYSPDNRDAAVGAATQGSLTGDQEMKIIQSTTQELLAAYR